MAVDALRTPRWGFRARILTAQTLMGLTLLPLVWVDPVALPDAEIKRRPRDGAGS